VPVTERWQLACDDQFGIVEIDGLLRIFASSFISLEQAVQ
jgi:hypothetical protein